MANCFYILHFKRIFCWNYLECIFPISGEGVIFSSHKLNSCDKNAISDANINRCHFCYPTKLYQQWLYSIDSSYPDSIDLKYWLATSRLPRYWQDPLGRDSPPQMPDRAVSPPALARLISCCGSWDSIAKLRSDLLL